MQRISLSLAALGLLYTTSSSASTFQHQVAINQVGAINDYGNGVASVNYDYFFSPVKNNKGPFRLAEFLAQNSKVSVTAFDIEELSRNQIYGRYVFENKWFASLKRTNVHDYADVYGAEVGYYYDEYTKITFAYDHETADRLYRIDAGDFRSDNTSHNYRFSVVRFLPFAGGSGLLLSAGLSYKDKRYKHSTPNSITRDSANNKQINVSAEYFVNDSLSFLAKYNRFDASNNPDGSDDSLLVGINYWWQINDNYSFTFSAMESVTHSSDMSLNLGFTGRF